MPGNVLSFRAADCYPMMACLAIPGVRNQHGNVVPD